MSARYAELKALEDNVLHPMSLPALDREQPLFVARGEGVHIFDQDGRRYLDGMGGLWCVNVGHGHPKMNEAIREQLDKIAYFNTFGDCSNEPSLTLASKMIGMLGPEEMDKVFFSSGGSDAVESALKLSRQYWRMRGQPDKTRFISLKHAYHGVHFGGVSVAGLPNFKQYGPLIPGCSQIDSPFLYRNAWTDDPEELGAICAGLLDREIAYHGSGNVAAFIAEPIQGAGGVIVPPANFWPLVREVCDKHDVLLIADEVVTGFGRSGSLFGARGWGVKPDLMCFAKGLSSGYVPLGAVTLGRKVAEVWDEPSPDGFIFHGYTYSGHPLACAAGVASLEIVEKEDLPANAAEVGAYCLEQLLPLVDRNAHLGEVRGKGLMLALDLVVDKATKEPVNPATGYSDELSLDCQRNGVIVRPVGPKIILSPPLTFTKDNVDELVSALEGAFLRTKLGA